MRETGGQPVLRGIALSSQDASGKLCGSKFIHFERSFVDLKFDETIPDRRQLEDEPDSQ